MKAYLINMHLLVPRSRSSAKVKVKCKGYISQKMAVSGAFVFHKHIFFFCERSNLVKLCHIQYSHAFSSIFSTYQRRSKSYKPLRCDFYLSTTPYISRIVLEQKKKNDILRIFLEHECIFCGLTSRFLTQSA